jgi:hypothetical protein
MENNKEIPYSFGIGEMFCTCASEAYSGLFRPLRVHGTSSRFSKHLWNDTLCNVGFGKQAGSGSQIHVGFQAFQV